MQQQHAIIQLQKQVHYFMVLPLMVLRIKSMVHLIVIGGSQEVAVVVLLQKLLGKSLHLKQIM